MSESYFFLQAEQNENNATFLESLKQYSFKQKKQIYVIDKPLGDNPYSYEYQNALVILAPKHRILICDFGNGGDQFESYTEDFIEDLGSISDKYRYKEFIGRPRHWKPDLISPCEIDIGNIDVVALLAEHELPDAESQRKCELLISLLTGSINDIEKVKATLPDNLLDKVKRKILLFDGDQTRFVYQKTEKPRILVQGLSGTGKTELLLHKLKEIYVGSDSNRVLFTCHNRVLADNLRKRIPEFFNFMKVERQIEWNTRLWCVHAWGSGYDKNSGAYRYICDYYSLPFYRLSQVHNFDHACQLALQDLGASDVTDHAFDYILIDESQDFSEPFFELCEKVTKNTIYVAGDIFQTIFDQNIISNIEPDFLLSKCYRTDPRTLMFAHALGMGLFETPKLRWLEDKEWKACGYIVEKRNNNRQYRLKREPLRRFEDLQSEDVTSVEIVKTQASQKEDAETKVLEIIGQIRTENPTVTADDIGIIFIDNKKHTYDTADRLEQSIPREFGWVVNKAYESKEKLPDTIFVTNINNVKGLEFPFVICVSKKINNRLTYRNALYMMLSRSFIKSYLLLSADLNQELCLKIEDGLRGINANGYMDVVAPSDKEKQAIQTTFTIKEESISFYDFFQSVCDELDIPRDYRQRLMGVVKQTIGESFEKERLEKVIEFNYENMIEVSE
ncbi:MAG: DEAD/DEAH box helicase [Anaerolineales bacterium]|nr:DEAD/DEAH box helicase [Anaerolineales bacterium]